MNAKKISIIAVVFLIAAALAMPVVARPGGMNAGDYAWGSCGCHSNLGPINVAVTPSATTLDPGQWVNLTVALNGAIEPDEPGESGKVGVLLFAALTTTNSLPAEAGWVVVKDPSGSTAFNYYQLSSYTASANLRWTLLAPSTPGTHYLYVQVMHGEDDRPSYEEAAPLVFTVKGTVPAPLVSISAPAPGAVLTGVIDVTATVISADPTTSAVMYFDDVAMGSRSAPPFTWQVDTTAYGDGLHKIRVEASNSNPSKGMAQVSVVLNNTGHGLDNPNVIVIRAPFNDTTVSGPFDVIAEVVGGGTISSATLYIDGASQGSQTVQPYTWHVNSSLLDNGVHVLNVTAVGTSNGYDRIVIRTDNSPPAVTILSPTAGQKLSGIYTVMASITAPAAMARAELYVDATLAGYMTNGTWTYMLDTTTYSDGPHTIGITAYDVYGRSGTANVGVTFENTPAFDKQAWEINLIAMPIFVIGIVCLVLTAALYMGAKKGGEK
jgi:hypothetical protein